ncbi:MAG TPA: SCO family protein [Rhodocyclaceae bacterium]|nr:SCO family protein [Rhodocyclaceae bacterium]
MSQRLLLALVVILATAVVGLALFWQPQLSPPSTAPGAPAGGDFVLDSADGPVDTAALRGKVVLVYFGYTYCPDICPTSLTVTSQALNQLSPAELALVKTVFVSVDPERDTPARLKDYVKFFHPSMVGVTGTPAAIAAAARKYGAIYARQDVGSTAGYVVDHSAWTYVVAPDGHLAGRIPHGATIEQTLAEIRKWLPSSPTPKGTS